MNLLSQNPDLYRQSLASIDSIRSLVTFAEINEDGMPRSPAANKKMTKGMGSGRGKAKGLVELLDVLKKQPFSSVLQTIQDQESQSL